MMHGAHPGFLLEAVFSLPKYWSQSCVKRYIHYAMLEYTESKLDYSTIIRLCLIAETSIRHGQILYECVSVSQISVQLE